MTMQDSERLIREALADGKCELYRTSIRKFDEALAIRRRICGETDPKLMEAFFHCGTAQLILYNYYIKLRKLFYNPEIRPFLPHGIHDYDDILDKALVSLLSSREILERQEPRSINTMNAVIIYTVLAEAQFSKALYEAANSNADRALGFMCVLQGHPAKVADLRLKKAACFYQLGRHTEAKQQLIVAKVNCILRLADLTAQGETEALSWISRNCDDLLHYINNDCKSGCKFCVNRVL